MKRSSLWVLVVLSLVSVLCALNAQASMVIEPWFTYVPCEPATRSVWISESGRPAVSYGFTVGTNGTPDQMPYYYGAEGDVITPGTLIRSSGFVSWKGNLVDPSVPIWRIQKGGKLSLVWRLESVPEYVRFGDVSLEIISSRPDIVPSTSVSLAGVWTNMAQGYYALDYGDDHKSGGGGDIPWSSPTALVNNIVFATDMVSVGLDASTFAGANSAEQLQSATAFLLSAGSITFTGTVTVRDPTGTMILGQNSVVTTMSAVPEPVSAVTLLGLGLGTLLFSRKRR